MTFYPNEKCPECGVEVALPSWWRKESPFLCKSCFKESQYWELPYSDAMAEQQSWGDSKGE